MAPADSEPLKFSSRAVTTLDEEDEDWENTLRPGAIDTAVARSNGFGHSRESSTEKLQRTADSASSSPVVGQAPPTVLSRLHTAASRTADRVVEPKSATYGHHRQTSIVHGIQHSRNGSLASSSSSPLSPQVIAAAGHGVAQDRSDCAGFLLPDKDSLSTSRPSTAVSGSMPTSALQGLERTGSAGVVGVENTAQYMPQRRLERIQSGRTRRENGHQHSHSSRHHNAEPQTVGDNALHVLFTTFIAQAEEKLNNCITIPFEPEPQVELICGSGVDPAFDQLIEALAHISNQKPKPLIDLMMLWRKSKSDAASEARNQLSQSSKATDRDRGALQRRNTEPVNSPTTTGNGVSDVGPSNASTTLAVKQEYVAQAERRSTVSIYILCRVLIEIIQKSSLAFITPEMEDKLEGIIFGQLKIAEMEQLILSPLKMANWNLFAQLLGVMSGINFVGVTERFISDLDRSLQELAMKSQPHPSRDLEGRMELVLGGMKNLKIPTCPPEAWDQTCSFMASMGKLFGRAPGPKVKASFCQVLDMLLMPIAATANNADFAHPRWSEVLGAIGPRLAQMFVKPRHWAYTFPLTATMLCVSPSETFGSQWLQLIYPLQARLKDRYTRPLCLQVISRLLWTYLYRTTDTPAGTIRKLDEVMKQVLPNGKRFFSATETAVTDALIQIIRMIGYKHPEHCFRSILFSLVNADQMAGGKDLKIENLDPDRNVIGIRAFLAVMADLERGEQGRPPFPLLFGSTSTLERSPPSPSSDSPLSSALPSPAAASCDDRLSKPVMISALTDTVREYYVRFCEILGTITILCDNAFGGHVSLDEKLSVNSPGSRTPITESFNFAKREDAQMAPDQKQAYYELLHVAVQALPRCLLLDIPPNTLINLLCTGTAHAQYAIADSSAQSLKAIARQCLAQSVVTGYSRFVFTYDDHLSAMSDGGLLALAHVENTLKLYAELLQIWVEEIQRKTRAVAGDDASGDGRLDAETLWSEVDRMEAHGLFFLCSQSRRVRFYAVTVLRLITEFDAALRKCSVPEHDGLQIIDILENYSKEVMDFNDENLSVAERSRLERGMQSRDNRGALVELCTSDVTYDSTLWFKLFPNFVRIAFEKCPRSVTICRELVLSRIMQMYKAITILSEPSRAPNYGSEPGSARVGSSRTSTAQPELVVEQWKLYLVFACKTLDNTGCEKVAQPVQPAQATAPQNGKHERKTSKSAAERPMTARTLFKYLNPMLSVSNSSVREAVTFAMGSINISIYRTLLEELQGQVSRCTDEARARIHQRTNSSPRRNRKMDLLRTEITYVYKLTAHFLTEPDVYQDDWVMSNLVSYARDLKLFLQDQEVQIDWEFQKLRRHFCGLMEQLYEGINRTKDPTRWMTFDSRRSSFALTEDWCGFSPNQTHIRQREDEMRQTAMDQQTAGERGTLTAAMEIEKRNLRTAALRTMAALCAGPVAVTLDNGATYSFDVRRLVSWIESIYASNSDRMNLIGRRALKNLIMHNQDHPYLLEHCIARCYAVEGPKVLASYFNVVADVLLDHADYPYPFCRLLGICLYILGSEQSEVRTKAAHLLRVVEQRQPGARNPKIQDFDISISDKTKAVYKLAQFEISKRLAKQYSELAVQMFAEYTRCCKELPPHVQKDAIAVVLPWIQTIELKVDPNGGPVTHSFVLLVNLLEITIKWGAAMHNEVQALWQALATGPHGGNVRLVLDFIVSLCLERREQNFVEYAKQIVVFLASTSSTPGNKVVEYLLLHVTPKSMVPLEKRDAVLPPPDVNALGYCADLAGVLPMGTKQAGFSLGQLSLILLVDLMVAPVSLAPEKVPVLLHAVTVLWDHYTALVQDQAREMLVHLMHELVVSRLPDDVPSATKKWIEGIIDAIRRHDRSVVWSYEDSNGKPGAQDNKVPPSMEYLTGEVVKMFELSFPGIKDQWCRLSLTWATSCPVRHLACRSFQIFRCIFTSLDLYMLGDMLARLSNTVADVDTEIQTFSMEILTTLNTLMAKLDGEKLLTFPQLFWTMCACLDSINEPEFQEGVEMLNGFLAKVDLQSPGVRRILLDGQPTKWDGPFEGMQPLLYKGLRSSVCLDTTLATLDKVVQLPSDGLVGDSTRIFFAIVANWPRLLHALEDEPMGANVAHSAQVLLSVVDSQGYADIAVVLQKFLSAGYQSGDDFVSAMHVALRKYFLPALDFRMVTMLMSFLTNNSPWLRLKTLRILSLVIPETDMRRPEMVNHGSDLISPLLRLLQTEYCMEALTVLETIKTMSGSSMDKHQVRMSMTRPTSKAIRKEYERTPSLFGIPEPSGWAIPIPAKRTESTRANVHAAFYKCQSAEGIASDPDPTPEVEFHADDFPYGYFSASERADTMMSDDGRGDGRGDGPSMGDLVSRLDSLDDFFDDLSSSAQSEGKSSKTVTEYAPETSDISGAQLYDEQILPFLQEVSSTSNTCFQNGFADRSPVMLSRENGANTMNPAAFNFDVGPGPAIQTPNTTTTTKDATTWSTGATTPSRPRLHSRSATSPSPPASHAPPGDLTSDDDAEDVFSDGDDDRFRLGGGVGAGAPGSFFLENMIKPLAHNTRSRMRRIAGARSRDERYPVPPEVPRLPNAFTSQQARSQTSGDML